MNDGGKLNVFLGADLAGKIWLDPRGRWVFQYEEKWLSNPRAIPLSMSLPLRKEAFADDLPRPFFANVLPEGDVRAAITRALGISEENDFQLLGTLGGECAGAVSVSSEDEAPAAQGSYRPLSNADLLEMIEAMPRRPLLLSKKGLRLSLAGAQQKLGVYWRDGKLYLPLAGSASSHILKPRIQRFAATVENEALCMHLAESVGLPVPECFIRDVGQNVYVVARYDRATDADGNLVRIHQEDFCQALGVPPGRKYETEGGPSFARCFDLVGRASLEPAKERVVLLRWLIFNLLIGNADAHAKNLSFLLREEGHRLAPFYDLLCTAVYPDLSPKLAMKIGGEDRPDWIQRRHWERLSQEILVKPRLVFDLCREVASDTSKHVERTAREVEAAHGRKKTLREVVSMVQKRSARLLRSVRE